MSMEGENGPSTAKRGGVWLYARLSSTVIQVCLAIAIAVVVALIWPRLFSTDITTWHYFMSTVFQGLAALVSVSLLAFFFFHERTEARIQALTDSCVSAAHEISSSYPYYLNEPRLLEKLREIRSIMRGYEEVAIQAELAKQGKAEPPDKEKLRIAREQWQSWCPGFLKARAAYESLNRARMARPNLAGLVSSHVVPMFIPLAWSILMLASTAYSTETDRRYTFSMAAGLFMTLIVTLRFAYALTKGISAETKGVTPGPIEPATIVDILAGLDVPRAIDNPVALIEFGSDPRTRNATSENEK